MLNAYPDTRWCAMRFRFEFIDQKAREDATATGSAQNEVSQLLQVTDKGYNKADRTVYRSRP